jgi:hypothetical protein
MLAGNLRNKFFFKVIIRDIRWTLYGIVLLGYLKDLSIFFTTKAVNF